MPIFQKTAAFLTVPGIYDIMSLTTIAVPLGQAVLDGPYDNLNRNRKTRVAVDCENGRIRLALAIKSVQPKDVSRPICPATEMPAIPKYNSDGYWRGPIWAPTTYLLADGLRRCGQDRLAKTIAQRYCNMSCRKAKGNYENFDALTGLGRRAPGYTWATSVYMMLHLEYGF